MDRIHPCRKQGSVGVRTIAAIATERGHALSRYRARRLMQEQQIHSCQKPGCKPERLKSPSDLACALAFPISQPVGSRCIIRAASIGRFFFIGRCLLGRHLWCQQRLPNCQFTASQRLSGQQQRVQSGGEWQINA